MNGQDTRQQHTVVTMHLIRRSQHARGTVTTWCGLRMDANPPAAAQALRQPDTIQVSCPLCEAAQIVDKTKLADLFD